MFVHLIQFEVTDGLDLGLLDRGAHVTLGLSSSSRLWTRFFRGSGEHPVDTSGDLKQRQEVYKCLKKKKKKVEEGYTVTPTEKIYPPPLTNTAASHNT